jgi:hypothetical protein
MVRSTICYVSLVNTEYWCYATVRIIEISNTEVGIIRYYLRYLFVCSGYSAHVRTRGGIFVKFDKFDKFQISKFPDFDFGLFRF